MHVLCFPKIILKKHLCCVVRLSVLLLVVVIKCMIFACFYTDYMLVLRYIYKIVCM